MHREIHWTTLERDFIACAETLLEAIEAKMHGMNDFCFWLHILIQMDYKKPHNHFHCLFLLDL